MSIVSNPTGNGYLVARFTANGAVNLNSATDGANTSDTDVVTKLGVAAITWTNDTGSKIIIKRNDVSIFDLYGNGNEDFSNISFETDAEKAQDFTIEFTGLGSAVVKFHKNSDYPTSYQG